MTALSSYGPIKLDNSPVECSIRPTILNRKNAVFAGSEHCSVIASVIETCKLNDVDPLA